MDEMGVPPVALAVLYAAFDAAGNRVRPLPLRQEDLRDALGARGA